MRSSPRPTLPSLATAVLLTLIGAFAPDTAGMHAQELRGTVLASDRVTPSSGVVLVLLHATRDDSIVARTVTGDRGRFSLRPPAGTLTRLRILRVGFMPMDIGRFTLAAGELRDTTLSLSDTRVNLATVNVKGNSRCEVRPEGGLRVAQLFDAARTALISTTAKIYGSTSNSEYVMFERLQDRRGSMLAPVARTPKGGGSLQPFESLGADSLARYGYMIPNGDEATYYAPDAHVLLSDTFLTHHCLFLVEGKDATAPFVGIGFRPVGKRVGIVDVRGTFWIDRTSQELQYLEYEYEGLPEVTRNAGLGGRVDYAQMANGAWFVSSWSIRMPMVERRTLTLANGPFGAQNSRQVDVVVGQQITGGEVQSISVDESVLFQNTHALLAGYMPQDSASVRTFSPDVATAPTGFATRESVARMDSSAVAALCGAALSPTEGGLVTGRVLDQNRNGVAGMLVRARWVTDISLRAGNVSMRNMSAEVSANALGSYQMCGMPFDRSVTVSAMTDSRRLRSSVVRLSQWQPAALLDLNVGAPPSQRR